jgi:predicted DNA-binding transcriptional regulator YafY
MLEVQVNKFKRIFYLYDMFREGFCVNRHRYTKMFNIKDKTFYRDMGLIRELTGYIIESDKYNIGLYRRIKL